MRKLTLVAFSCHAVPAIACQDRAVRSIAAKSLDGAALSEIAASDAIVDARVDAWTSRGITIDVLRVWKGRVAARINVVPIGCGPLLPDRDPAFRIMLNRDRTTGEWVYRDPSAGGRIADQRRFDRVIDRRIGAARRASFMTITALPPPPPR